MDVSCKVVCLIKANHCSFIYSPRQSHNLFHQFPLFFLVIIRMIFEFMTRLIRFVFDDAARDIGESVKSQL